MMLSAMPTKRLNYKIHDVKILLSMDVELGRCVLRLFKPGPLPAAPWLRLTDVISSFVNSGWFFVCFRHVSIEIDAYACWGWRQLSRDTGTWFPQSAPKCTGLAETWRRHCSDPTALLPGRWLGMDHLRRRFHGSSFYDRAPTVVWPSLSTHSPSYRRQSRCRCWWDHKPSGSVAWRLVHLLIICHIWTW